MTTGRRESRQHPRFRWPSGTFGALGLAELAVRQTSANQLGARRDPELGEHLAQVIVHGARTQVQLRRDLAVGQAVGDKPGDLEFLRGEPGQREGVAPAGGLAGGAQLGLGALGPGNRS
jgi:hypothetical protein